MHEFKTLFRTALNDNLSVAAFVENPQGGKPIMAALNVLYLGGKGENIDFSKIIVKNTFILNMNLILFFFFNVSINIFSE